jgi:putative Mn2+ efflux pump MntP
LSLPELFILAVGLSMDTFAVGICIGLSMEMFSAKKALTAGLYFGGFQAGMPVAGYFAATLFTGYVIGYGHWVAFALLSFLGGKMIAASRKNTDCPDCESRDGDIFKPSRLLPLSVATSIDALAVGVSFAFLSVRIVPAVLLIGVTTLALSVLGIKIGNVFGAKYKAKAEFFGGVILVLIGLKILVENF